MTKNILPLLYAESCNQTSKIWIEPINWNDSVSIHHLVQTYCLELQACNGNTDEEVKKANKFCADILAVKDQQLEIDESLLMFIQFQSATILIDLLSSKKLFSLVFDWIANSISDQLDSSIAREVDANRLTIFIHSNQKYIQKHVLPIMSCWCKDLFYYSRSSGGYKELIEFFILNCYYFLKSRVNAAFFQEDLLHAFIQMLGWANKYRMDLFREDTSKILLYYYNIEGFPEKWKRYIAFQFSCNGFQFTPKTRLEWCDIFEEHGDLSNLEKLHLILNRYSDDSKKIIEHINEIEIAIDNYNSQIDTKADKYESYEQSKAFTLLEPAFVSLLKSGNVELINCLIRRFFKLLHSEQITNTLIALPSTKDGVLYAIEGLSISTQKDPFFFNAEIIKDLNTFLSTTITANDVFSLRIEPLIREAGIPKPEAGIKLEKVLVEYFSLNSPAIQQLYGNKNGYFLYYGFQLPLQPLMVKYIGFSLPLIHSFVKPLEIQKIKSVLIWQGDTLLSERECDAVDSLFKKNGVVVKRLFFYSSSKEEFMENYASAEYDVIWVSCHGQFEHYKPHNSYLVLRQEFDQIKEITISYEDLLTHSFDTKKARRLLVLNACDGATTSLNNNPTSIGLGPSVIDRFQSLISHQWPIDNTAGLIYGILIAINLLDTNSYLDAYDESVKTFLEGKVSIINKLKNYQVSNDIIESLESSSLDLSSFFYWGSISYLE